jgi:hypothetical protein
MHIWLDERRDEGGWGKKAVGWTGQGAVILTVHASPPARRFYGYSSCLHVGELCAACSALHPACTCMRDLPDGRRPTCHGRRQTGSELRAEAGPWTGGRPAGLLCLLPRKAEHGKSYCDRAAACCYTGVAARSREDRVRGSHACMHASTESSAALNSLHCCTSMIRPFCRAPPPAPSIDIIVHSCINDPSLQGYIIGGDF